MKFILLAFLYLIVIDKVVGQGDSLLFEKNMFKIYRASAIFKGDTIYDAKRDLNKFIQQEDTIECKLNYMFYYNPLSLIGEYYSYESG